MIREHFWGPYPPALSRAEKLAAGCKRTPGAIILELGPGAIPFSQATHFVDREGSAPSPAIEALIAAENLADDPASSPAARYSAPRFSGLDLSHEALPFDDGEVDFLYARHVLEDLADPLNLLHEIARVAKAGYIETPSPVAELCRGVDGGSPPWRGYHHHRTICWVEDEPDNTDAVLHLVAKYPIIEHLSLDTIETWLDAGSGQEMPITLEYRLNEGPLNWNTYVFFDQGIDWKLHEHDVDMKVWDGTYEKLLNRGVKATLARNKRFAEKLEKLEKKKIAQPPPFPILPVEAIPSLLAKPLLPEVDWEAMLARDPATPHVESISPSPLPGMNVEVDPGMKAGEWRLERIDRPVVIEHYDIHRWPGALAQRWWAHDDGGLQVTADEVEGRNFSLFPSILVGGSWVGGRDLEDLVSTYSLRGVLSLDDHERRGHLPENQGLMVLAMPTPDDCNGRPATFWWRGIKFARGVLAKGRLMVACDTGKSRSAAMTYAILRCVLGMPPRLARERILRGIPESGPHPSWSSIQGYIQSIEAMIDGLSAAMEDF